MHVHFVLSIEIVSDFTGFLIFILLINDIQCGHWAKRTKPKRNRALTTIGKGEKQVLPDVNERFSKNCALCPDVYLPVCTNKSKSYQNTCLFLCKRRKREGVVRRGVCILFRRSNEPWLPSFPTLKKYR